MTRTSSDGTRDGFRPRFIAFVIVLSLACGGLVLANFLVGPRLDSATVDRTLVTTRADQQLRLFSTEPVASVGADQVSVTPAVPVTVSVDARVIAVQFSAPLRYDTTYTVTVRGVHTPYDGQRSTLRYTFHTADASLYFLDRGDGVDSIVRTSLNDSRRTVVYSAPRIQDFVRCGAVLVVAALDDSGESSLALVDPGSTRTQPIELPEAGTVDDLRASDAGTAAGFTFTSTAGGLTPDYDKALFEIDFSGAGAPPTAIAGLDGTQLSVTDWRYVPDTAQLAVHTVAGDVAIVDPATSDGYLPLGSFAEFSGVSTDGSQLLVGDQLGPIALTITDRTQTRIEPSTFDGVEPYGGDAVLLRGGVRLQNIAVPDASAGTFATRIVRDDGSSSTQVFQAANDAGRVIRLSATANDQLLVVEFEPDSGASISDRYAVNARSTTIQTAFVDINTGRTVRTIGGFDVSW